MTTTATPSPEANIIEPEWKGIERSIWMLILWILISLLFIPVILGGIYSIIWNIATRSYDFPVLIPYVLAIFTGTIPFLDYMYKKGRVYLLIPSQNAALLTYDLPSTAKKESTDSQETTTQVSVKLGEGGHILSPFDQLYAVLPIEVDYQVVVPDFRVSIDKKGGKKRDMKVKQSVANFETDSENLLRLARISLDEATRIAHINNSMSTLIQRLIGEECRNVVNNPDTDTSDDPADRSQYISDRVQKRLKDEIEGKFYGIKLKNFTLGDIDKPKLVEDARDQAAAVEVLQEAATKLMNDLNEGVSPAMKISPSDAIDRVYVGARIKETKRTENVTSIDSATLAVLGEVAVGIIKALKSKEEN
jgi:hypothetical protein